MDFIKNHAGKCCAKTVGVFFGLLIFLMSGFAAKADDADFYSDTRENQRRFSDALQFFHSPSSFDGYTEESLRAQFAQHTEVLRHYRFEQVAEKVKDALYDEVAHLDTLRKNDKLEFADVRFWFFINGLNILTSIGNASDAAGVDVVVTEMNGVLAYLNEQQKNRVQSDKAAATINPEIKKELMAYTKLAQAVNLALPARSQARASAFDDQDRFQLALGKEFLSDALPEDKFVGVRLANYESAPHKGIAWIKEMRERMSKRAKGQPEAIEAFMHLEHQRINKPARKLPEVLWLFGVPGTGKDTHAMEYIDALHGYEGAHEEHLLTIEPSQDTNDTWKHFGPNPGYVGSDKLSDLVHFLVKHSGGRYKIEKVKSFSSMVERVVETGVVTAENGPNTGVLFLNEFHDWSKAAADVMLKKALERGTFPINNANGGLSSIKVPITIVIASNDGTDLVVPDGHTKGRKLTYEEAMEIWRSNYRDYDRIKESIMDKNTVRRGEKTNFVTGISDAVFNRIRKSALILLRPLSPEVLKEIAQSRVDKLAKDFAHAGHAIGQTKFVFSDDVAIRLQEFLYNAEEGARYLGDNAISLIEGVLDRAIADEIIAKSSEPRNILVDIVTNPDLTWSLKLSFRSQSGDAVLGNDIFLPIEATQVLKKKEAMSDAEIERILSFERYFSESIVGADHLANKLQESLLAAENARHAGKEDRAQAFLFLGMSSTGKSQSAKEVAKFLHGSEADLVTIDFNGLVSEAQVRHLIFGEEQGTKSPFMKAFDRKHGKVVFLFDEIANVANPNILTPLYQLLREKTIDGFNDGRPRSMEGVTIVMTGNAGEEIYQGIPDHVPERVRRAAAAEIYQKFVNSPLKQRAYLQSRFREAFLNRVGYANTFFFAPLDFQAVRELIRIKLSAELKSLATQNGRNYHVEFASDADLERTLDVFEKEGFHFKTQGQSVDDYVSQQFRQKLLVLLQKNLIPTETRVVLSYKNRHEVGDGDDKRYFENFNVQVDGFDKELTLTLNGKITEREPADRYQDKIQTAFHEAGHEILRQAMLGDLSKPQKISIIPGVAEIAGEYIYYAGVAAYELHTRGAMTKKFVLGEMAKLIAGGEAQRLINKGHASEGGQSNDLERANYFAKLAILKFGLEPSWGLAAPTSHQTIQEYMASLSERDTIRLEKMVGSYMKEAKRLAHDVLAINYDAFIALGVELAKHGEIDGKQILAVYEKHPVENYWKMGSASRKLKVFNLPFLKTWAQGLLSRAGRDLVMVSSVPMIAEKEVANIDDILEERRLEGINKARPLGKLPVQSKEAAQATCARLMGEIARRAG